MKKNKINEAKTQTKAKQNNTGFTKKIGVCSMDAGVGDFCGQLKESRGVC